ncbi:follistatin-A-like isoform X2 [Glandiceps talaboti]
MVLKNTDKFSMLLTSKTITMKAVSPSGCYLVTLLVVLAANCTLGQAGLCWSQKAKDGTCKGLMSSNMTKEACCRSGVAGFAWSSKDVTASQLFRWKLGLSRKDPGECALCHGESLSETCDGVDCPKGKTCKISKKGRPRCVCSPDCSKHRHRGQVCGSDGNTYQNECQMKKAVCRQGQNISIAYYGVCKTSCNGIICAQGSCIVDQNNQPHCVSCNIDCSPPGPSDMICGANGVTYESACQLRVATCLLGRSIGAAYNGECQGSLSCSTLSCVNGKQCLVNPETLAPRCVTCHLPECQDDEIMPFESKICGTDNQTYNSWCDMRRKACNKGIVIDTQYFGKCLRRQVSQTTVGLANPELGQGLDARLEASGTEQREPTNTSPTDGGGEFPGWDWEENSEYSEYTEEELRLDLNEDSDYIEPLPENMAGTLEELIDMMRNS